VPSGVPIQRPQGQIREDGAAAPEVAPTRALDYECEVAAWVGRTRLIDNTGLDL